MPHLTAIPLNASVFRMLLLTALLCAVDLAGVLVAATVVPFNHSHPVYAGLLKSVVSHGLVNYAKIVRDPSNLNTYLGQLSAVTTNEFSGWTRNQQLAFLCNSYNAATLHLIVQNYPVQSIRDIGGLFDSPWDRRVLRLLGSDRSLDEIEHQMIVHAYREPRVHFVLVCASRGCPPLRVEPYTGESLDRQLDAQRLEFLSDRTKNRVDAEHGIVWLSPIFKWYAEDFKATGGSVMAYVDPYLADRHSVAHLTTLKIKYTEYDWALNDGSPDRE